MARKIIWWGSLLLPVLGFQVGAVAAVPDGLEAAATLSHVLSTPQLSDGKIIAVRGYLKADDSSLYLYTSAETAKLTMVNEMAIVGVDKAKIDPKSFEKCLNKVVFVVGEMRFKPYKDQDTNPFPLAYIKNVRHITFQDRYADCYSY